MGGEFVDTKVTRGILRFWPVESCIFLVLYSALSISFRFAINGTKFMRCVRGCLPQGSHRSNSLVKTELASALIFLRLCMLYEKICFCGLIERRIILSFVSVARLFLRGFGAHKTIKLQRGTLLL